MSSQFNFFACERDVELIYRELFQVLPACVIINERKPIQENIDERVFTNLSAPIYGITTENFLGRITFSENPDSKQPINFRLSCAVEYSPCRIIGTTLQIGRFACFCDDEAIRKLGEKLFRRLKKQAERLPNTPYFYVYPTAKRIRKLADVFGVLFDNPFLASPRGVESQHSVRP